MCPAVDDCLRDVLWKERHAAAACWQKMGKPEWADQMAQPGLRRVAELEAQVRELTGKLGSSAG
jgi:hypothetical protein